MPTPIDGSIIGFRCRLSVSRRASQNMSGCGNTQMLEMLATLHKYTLGSTRMPNGASSASSATSKPRAPSPPPSAGVGRGTPSGRPKTGRHPLAAVPPRRAGREQATGIVCRPGQGHAPHNQRSCGRPYRDAIPLPRRLRGGRRSSIPVPTCRRLLAWLRAASAQPCVRNGVLEAQEHAAISAGTQ